MGELCHTQLYSGLYAQPSVLVGLEKAYTVAGIEPSLLHTREAPSLPATVLSPGTPSKIFPLGTSRESSGTIAELLLLLFCMSLSSKKISILFIIRIFVPGALKSEQLEVCKLRF